MRAAAIETWMKRSPSLIFFFSIHFSAENPLSSPANFTAWAEVSQAVIGPIPLRPARRPSQVLSVSIPTGLTAPMPVMTTRRIRRKPYHGGPPVSGRRLFVRTAVDGPEPQHEIHGAD